MATAVVTGASRGLGVALTRELLSRGYRVGACATTKPGIEGALCRVVDVGHVAVVNAFAAEVADELGAIDLWINCAGVLGPLGPLLSTTTDAWTDCMQVNVLGVLNGMRAFLAHRSESQPMLINIASRAGIVGLPGLAAYSASKAAVIALTSSVAAEVGPSGVRVIAVVPPSVETDMQETLQGLDERVFPMVEQWRQRRAQGGIVEPEVAAALILDAALAYDGEDPIIDLVSAGA